MEQRDPHSPLHKDHEAQWPLQHLLQSGDSAAGR